MGIRRVAAFAVAEWPSSHWRHPEIGQSDSRPDGRPDGRRDWSDWSGS